MKLKFNMGLRMCLHKFATWHKKAHSSFKYTSDPTMEKFGACIWKNMKDSGNDLEGIPTLTEHAIHYKIKKIE